MTYLLKTKEISSLEMIWNLTLGTNPNFEFLDKLSVLFLVGDINLVFGIEKCDATCDLFAL